MQLKIKMSVENFPYRRSLRNRMGFPSDEVYISNFQRLQESYKARVKSVKAGRSPGPGRIFYTTSGVDYHASKLSYQPFENSRLDDIIEACGEFSGIDSLIESEHSIYYGSSVDSEKLKNAISHLNSAVSSFTSSFIEICRNNKFPYNLYDMDMSASNDVRNLCLMNLQALEMGVAQFLDFASKQNVTRLPFIKQEEVITPTVFNTDVYDFADSMALRFSSGFENFLYSDPRVLVMLVNLLEIYQHDLRRFIQAFNMSDNFSGENVSIFDILGPYVFLDVILLITKHAVELREFAYISKKMIKNY